MRMRGALLLGTGQLLQDARAAAGLREKQLMEGSTVHVLRSARPHTLVSTSEFMRAALCGQQTVSYMRMCCALLLGAGQLLQDARAPAVVLKSKAPLVALLASQELGARATRDRHLTLKAQPFVPENTADTSKIWVLAWQRPLKLHFWLYLKCDCGPGLAGRVLTARSFLH